VLFLTLSAAELKGNKEAAAVSEGFGIGGLKKQL
jgi:hypothetical protein